jgi:hypothetical protein
VCLFHWPDYLGWHAAVIADEILEFCHRHQLHFAHVGLSLSIPTVVMADPKLWDHPPSQAVQLTSVCRVENLDGNPCDAEPAMIDYFTNGGIILGVSGTDA